VFYEDTTVHGISKRMNASNCGEGNVGGLGVGSPPLKAPYDMCESVACGTASSRGPLDLIFKIQYILANTRICSKVVWHIRG
jgi:hypothetical protein